MILLNDQITEHFRLSEFSNTEDGDVMLLNPEVVEFLQMLEEFRIWYNRPMNINSGYRTAAYNKKVGGVLNSYHLKGLAADVALPNEFFGFSKERKDIFLENMKVEWYKICHSYGKKGSAMYHDTFIHMSLWPTWYFEDKRGK